MQDIESTSYILPPEACVSNQFYIKEKGEKRKRRRPHNFFTQRKSSGKLKSLTNQTIHKLVDAFLGQFGKKQMHWTISNGQILFLFCNSGGSLTFD